MQRARRVLQRAHTQTRGSQLTDRKLVELELSRTVQYSDFGALISDAGRRKVQELVQQLEGANPNPSPVLAGSVGSPEPGLQGTWCLMYTTEKSVHGIVRLLPVDKITQTIELRTQRVTNAIIFKGGATLQAGAPLKVVNPQRIAYKFDTLTLAFTPQLSFTFPFKAGGGWTEAVYCTETCRIMRNSLQDTLVFTRDR